jgi:cell division transport system permease protein
MLGRRTARQIAGRRIRRWARDQASWLGSTLRRTAKGMGGALSQSALVTLTLWAALLVVGIFAVGLHNVQGLVGRWGQAGHIGVSLTEGATPAAWQRARDRLAELPGVEQARLVTPGQALQRFAQQSAAAAALVEGVPEEVLPPLVELRLRDTIRQPTQVEHILAAARQVVGVQGVDLGLEQFSALQSMVELLRLGSWVFGSAVLLAAALICANTIRLVVHSRGDEIAMIQLVGGTANFVRLPYVLQGIVWGCLASGLANLTLWILHRQVAPPMSAAAAAFTGHFELQFFTASVAWGLLGCGVVLGALGSGMAVQRYLHAKLL